MIGSNVDRSPTENQAIHTTFSYHQKVAPYHTSPLHQPVRNQRPPPYQYETSKFRTLATAPRDRMFACSGFPARENPNLPKSTIYRILHAIVSGTPFCCCIGALLSASPFRQRLVFRRRLGSAFFVRTQVRPTLKVYLESTSNNNSYTHTQQQHKPAAGLYCPVPACRIQTGTVQLL